MDQSDINGTFFDLQSNKGSVAPLAREVNAYSNNPTNVDDRDISPEVP